MEEKLIRKRKKFKLNVYQVIGLGFMSIILVGTIFLALPISNSNGQWLNFTDSLFTATSSVCVTGLAVRITATDFTIFGQVVIIILIQLGGIGFMTIASLIFIIIGKRISLKDRLAITESYNQDNLQGMVKLVLRVVLLTLIIEFIGAIMMSFVFVPKYGAIGIYYSIFHSISAFCNAGFDIIGASSLEPFVLDIMMNLSVMMLITLGGLGFTVIIDIASKFQRKARNKFKFHTKIVLLTSLTLILSGSVVFFISEYNNPLTMQNFSLGEKILASFFQSVTPRTAGFAMINQDSLTPLSKFTTMLLMFIGASPASTGGGIKTTTFILLLFTFIAGAKGQDELELNHHSIPLKFLLKACTVVVYAMFLIGISSFVILFFEGDTFSLEQIVFECISAFCTVGLSLGITPSLGIMSKLILCVVMFCGRLGPLILGMLIIKKKNLVKLPEAKILIG